MTLSRHGSRRAGSLLWAALLCSGCASVDFDYPKQASYAVTDTAGTELGQQFAALSAEQPPEHAGFYMLRDGVDALTMRLRLIRSAERSLDLQYYIVKADTVGSLILLRLLDAADRGVRVRLLIDDIETAGYDAGLAGLDSHPNFEVRVYNPFSRGFAGRSRSALSSFGRINRRMHNKTFVADNQVAIIGGRNVGDEYFDAREDARFSDLDVLAVGPIVAEASQMFDTYWNHETALPLPAFARMPENPGAELTRLRGEFAAAREAVLDSRYADAVRDELRDYAELDTSALSWSLYDLVYDSPDKGVRRRADTAESIREPLVEALEGASTELVIVSPYFVPRRSGIERFSELTARQVDVKVITNSLASQNKVLVHGGYAPSRRRLLELGVHLHEIRPDADQSGARYVDPGDTSVTLHTKAFLVDRGRLFVGSFNFDPRSAYLNTESGIIISSPTLAEEFAAAVETALARRTYEVYLNDRGQLRWRLERNGEEIVYTREPLTSWWLRLRAGLSGLLPIREHL